MMVLAIILAVILMLALGLIIYIITIYNGLVRMKNNIDKSWSNIDVLLKQRYDELPKLVKVCEGYMQHERNTLEAVIKARQMISEAKSDGDAMEAQNMLSNTLKSLFAVTENYPELKADASFRQLQGRISELEDMIADRRELFNETVNLFNIHIEQFPDVFVANAMKLEKRDMWEINPEHREDPGINLNMG